MHICSPIKIKSIINNNDIETGLITVNFFSIGLKKQKKRYGDNTTKFSESNVVQI